MHPGTKLIKPRPSAALVLLPPLAHRPLARSPPAFYETTLRQTEFKMVAKATSVGFVVMGFIGFFVKLVHIPINNILMT